MPPSEIDWTKDSRDPRWLLGNWCTAAAIALNMTLDPQPAGKRHFIAGHECQMREEAAAAVANLNAPPDAPAPTLLAPARLTDRFGVSVFSGGHLSAKVLFVTPDNKSDSDAALAFAVRAAGLMSAGVGVVIVDALPGPASWATHLHSLTGVYPIAKRPRGGEAPVLVVHPRIEGGAEKYAVWHYAVAAGFPLPTVTVPVRGAMHPKLDLEATYTEACQRTRSPN